MGLKKYEIITVGSDKRVRALRSWAVGDRYVTLCGSYNQTTSKSWTGKRTITDVNEPEYDNNVKTQYDF